MKLKVILIVILSIFFLSCKTDKKVEKASPEKEVKEEVHNHNEHEAIVSDNGKKWKVADNMMAHIAKMNKNIVDFKGSSLEDYQELSQKLITDTNLLTSNCTMTGQAHDELHKWLLPYIDLINVFSEVKNKEEAKKQFNNIDQSFKILNEFFK